MIPNLIRFIDSYFKGILYRAMISGNKFIKVLNLPPCILITIFEYVIILYFIIIIYLCWSLHSAFTTPNWTFHKFKQIKLLNHRDIFFLNLKILFEIESIYFILKGKFIYFNTLLYEHLMSEWSGICLGASIYLTHGIEI